MRLFKITMDISQDGTSEIVYDDTVDVLALDADDAIRDAREHFIGEESYWDDDDGKKQTSTVTGAKLSSVEILNSDVDLLTDEAIAEARPTPSEPEAA